jgi:hypothetical protein
MLPPQSFPRHTPSFRVFALHAEAALLACAIMLALSIARAHAMM